MNLKALIKEPSTWRGVVWVVAAAGVAITPDQQTAIVTAGMALAGILGAFVPDN